MSSFPWCSVMYFRCVCVIHKEKVCPEAGSTSASKQGAIARVQEVHSNQELMMATSCTNEGKNNTQTMVALRCDFLP